MALLRPAEYHRTVHSLDPAGLRARGIAGLIVDLDGTLTGWNQREATPEVRQWLQRCAAAGLRLIIASNNGRERVAAFADAVGVPFLANAGKPGRGAFRRAMALLRTNPEETAVVGDQVFTDVLGGNRLGLYTILVTPLSRREFFGTRLISRPLERWVLRRYGLKPR